MRRQRALAAAATTCVRPPRFMRRTGSTGPAGRAPSAHAPGKKPLKIIAKMTAPAAMR